MDLFIQYDLQRLRSYAALPANNGKIQVAITPSLVCLRFSEVDYFNYCVCRQVSELPQAIEQARSFYSHSSAPHRLLIEEPFANERQQSVLYASGYRLKGRQMIMQSPTNPDWLGAESRATLEPVLISTLDSFTKDYLLGFESERKDVEPVVQNFRQLLRCPAIQLYRVIAREGPVGVAVLFRSGHHYLLAGGAILPVYRHQGYHVSALLQRVRHCQTAQAHSVSAWAYELSASHRNMRSIGMTPQKTFCIYER